MPRVRCVSEQIHQYPLDHSWKEHICTSTEERIRDPFGWRRRRIHTIDRSVIECWYSVSVEQVRIGQDTTIWAKWFLQFTSSRFNMLYMSMCPPKDGHIRVSKCETNFWYKKIRVSNLSSQTDNPPLLPLSVQQVKPQKESQFTGSYGARELLPQL